MSGTGKITGTGTSYALGITNTGTDWIKYWQLTVPAGVTITAFGTAPAGWQLGSPGPLPQPVLSGQSAVGIPPGGSTNFSFKTNGGLPAGLTSALKISNNGRDDFNVVVTGLTAGGGTPPPTLCSCKST